MDEVQALQRQSHLQLLHLTREVSCPPVPVDGLRQMEAQPTADSRREDDDDDDAGWLLIHMIKHLQTYYLEVHRWRKVSFTSRSTSAALVSGSLTFTCEPGRRCFHAHTRVHVTRGRTHQHGLTAQGGWVFPGQAQEQVFSPHSLLQDDLIPEDRDVRQMQ